MVPKQRQTLFFSATMPKAIAELGDSFLTDPVKVSVAPPSTTAERVEQYVTFVNQKEKQALLTLTLRREAIDRALVFTRTKHGADRVVKHLHAAGIPANAIHGNKSQPQRERALAEFRSGQAPILVATDIAARGIDVSGVSHVFNFELPNVPEQYVHRIGRTARAGATGIAVSFVADDERAYLRSIEKLTRVKPTIVPLPENFMAEQARLPLPPKSDARPERPQGQRPAQGPRRHEGERPAGGAPKRRFPPRKGPVGAHRGAVRKTGGR
jgi:ATP-dependent RNA helicase RhlE